MRYKIDIGGTNLRVYDGSREIFKRSCNGNINMNPNLDQELEKIILTLKIKSDILIGIAGFYSCPQQVKDELIARLEKLLVNFKVVSDAEFHALQLIADNELLISLGTGSVASYFDDGQFKILGGYGHHFGDMGSGYHFGKVLIQKYLNDFEAGLNLPYMKLVEEHFEETGRGVLTAILNFEKQKCSELSEVFMDDPQFEHVFRIYFEQFEIELQRLIKISCKQAIIINGSITKSNRFIREIRNLKLNITIR